MSDLEPVDGSVVVSLSLLLKRRLTHVLHELWLALDRAAAQTFYIRHRLQRL